MINDNRIQWQKRECPIKLELVPYGSGWEDVTLEISGKRHWWSISGCLGDGFGALVEKHGFAGFHTSVWESDVNMRHLCFLKGRPDAMQPYESGEEGEGAVSSFDEELSLLLFDM